MLTFSLNNLKLLLSTGNNNLNTKNIIECFKVLNKKIRKSLIHV